MLIFTRKPLQKIIINKDIVITILKTNSSRVKIGIEAPKGVEINRDEIQQQKDKNNGL